VDYALTYAHTVDEGTTLAARLSELADRGICTTFGFDTEFYNVRVGKESTVARAAVHFASLAWNPGGARFHPRGYSIPDAAVVSREVVTECRPFREFMSRRDIIFPAHNAPVDAHSMKNEGVDVNVVNTLTLARWVYPGRARAQYGGGGFTLGALGEDILGEGKIADFKDVFTRRWEEWKVKYVTHKRCACGEPGCRKRTYPLHSKHTWQEEIRTPVYLEEAIPLESVGPGHEVFERAKLYSAQDAVLAFCLYEVLLREMRKQERVVPWLPKKLIDAA
jgi:hypothetical protein